MTNHARAEAQFNLGVRYDTGEGVPQDYAEAVRWYRLAADQRHANVQINLGNRYANGEGVPQDYVQAHTWYRPGGGSGTRLSAVQPRAHVPHRSRRPAARCGSGAVVPARSRSGLCPRAGQPRSHVRQR